MSECLGCGWKRAPSLRRLELEGIIPRGSRLCDECSDFVAAQLLKIRALRRVRACCACRCELEHCNTLRQQGGACCGLCDHYERRDEPPERKADDETQETE